MPQLCCTVLPDAHLIRAAVCSLTMLFDHAGVVSVIYIVRAEKKPALRTDAQMHNQLLHTALHLIHNV